MRIWYPCTSTMSAFSTHTMHLAAWRVRAIQAGKWVVVAALAWQMFAVAVVAVPFSDHSPAALWVRTVLKPMVDPYIYVTHQWQRWHMFVPENPVYDQRFVVELVRPGIHHDAMLVSSDEAATLLANDAGARTSALSVACRRMQLAAGTAVWLAERDYVSPDPALLARPEDAMNMQLEWYQYYRRFFLCP